MGAPPQTRRTSAASLEGRKPGGPLQPGRGGAADSSLACRGGRRVGGRRHVGGGDGTEGARHDNVGGGVPGVAEGEAELAKHIHGVASQARAEVLPALREAGSGSVGSTGCIGYFCNQLEPAAQSSVSVSQVQSKAWREFVRARDLR